MAKQRSFKHECPARRHAIHAVRLSGYHEGECIFTNNKGEAACIYIFYNEEATIESFEATFHLSAMNLLSSVIGHIWIYHCSGRGYKGCYPEDCPTILRKMILEQKEYVAAPWDSYNDELFFPDLTNISPDPRVTPLLSDIARNCIETDQGFFALHDALIDAGAELSDWDKEPHQRLRAIAGALARNDWCFE